MTSGFYLKPRDIVVLPTPSQNTRGLVHPGLGSSLEPFILKGLLLSEKKRPPAGNSGPRGRPKPTLKSQVAPFCGDSVISLEAHLFGTRSERRSEKLSICCWVSHVRSGSRLSEGAVVKIARKEQCACCGEEKAGPSRLLMGQTVCPAGGFISAPRFIIMVCVLPSELTVLRTHRKHWALLSAAQFSQVAALVAKVLPSVAFGTCPAVRLELAPWSSLGGSPGGCERMLLASLFSHSSSWLPPVCECLEHICEAGE